MRQGFLLFVAILAAVAPACSDAAGAGSDSAALSVTIATPDATAYTNGTQTFELSVTGAPETVELLADNELLATLTAPYAFEWDTTSRPEGKVSVTARATRGGEQVTSEVRLVVVDRTPPTVTSFTPKADEFLVAIDTPIAAEFSEPMRLESATDDAVTVAYQGASGEVAKSLTLSPDGTKLTIKATDALAASKRLAVTLTERLTDLAGNAVPKTSWEWTLEPLPGKPGAPFADWGGIGANAWEEFCGFDGTTCPNNGAAGPRGFAVDAAGTFYVAESSFHRISKGKWATGSTVLAGSGTATFAEGTGAAASFNTPWGLARDGAGNLYVGDYGNCRIRKVTPAGAVTTLAGSGACTFANGTGAGAAFNGPRGIALDASGNLYVADELNHRIRKVTPGGVVTTLAGSGSAAFADGNGAAASFNHPVDVALDGSGNVYVADKTNRRIRRVTPAGAVTTIAGSGISPTCWPSGQCADGQGTSASFYGPSAIGLDATGDVLVADAYQGSLLRKVTASGRVASYSDNDLLSIWAFARDTSGNVFVSTGDSRVTGLATAGTGKLDVSFGAGAASGPSPITSYTASASASGQPTKMCTVGADKAMDGTLRCTITGLVSAVDYLVSVTATSAAGTSEPAIRQVQGGQMVANALVAPW